MSDTDFDKRIAELQEKITTMEACPKPAAGMSLKNTKLIAFAAVPLIVALCLYIFNPKIVRADHEDPENKSRSGKKVFKWTIVITLLVWAVMWLGYYYMGK